MIKEEQLLEEYNKLIDDILDECDWKSHFTGEEVCGLFRTSRVTEVGDNYFKTQNSVYSYKLL